MKTIVAWTLLLTGVSLLPAAAGNQTLLRNLNSADGTPEALAADSKGHLFVVFAPTTAHQTPRVVEMDLNGSRLASRDLSELDVPGAAIMDAQGELIVAGSRLVAGNTAVQGIVLKLDPQLQTVFSRSLPATVNAVAVDASGNIYLTGSTTSASFPVTAGAYQTKPPLSDNFGSAVYAFVTKISPGGDQLLYSTYFGSEGTVCNGGSFCVGKFGGTTGTAIAVDASGAVVIAGTTTATGLPTTPGVLAPTCTCGYYQLGFPGVTSGFIAKFQPSAAQQLQWSTFLNGALTPISVTVTSMTLDSAGDVIVGGNGPSGLPTTTGALQPSVVHPESTGTAFVLKLNNAGTAAVWGTYLGNGGSSIQAVRLDAQGRVLFSGYMREPPLSPFLPTYVARLTSDGSALIDFYTGPTIYYLNGGPFLAITSEGGFAAVSESGALWIETGTPGPSLLNVTNSTTGLYGGLTPAGLITLYGVGIGPQTPLAGQVQNGAFTSTLGGWQVLFDGVAAPLLYADSGQINTVVPGGVGASTHIQIVTPAAVIDGPTLPVTSSDPGIFRDSKTGFAAAVNQDGSINSASNPAKAGLIVTVFATGIGTGTYFPDGAVVPAGIYNWPGSVWVLTTNRSLEVTFAGNAPGLVAGVVQVNFRVPESLPPGNTLSFSVSFSGVSTRQYQIAAAP